MKSLLNVLFAFCFLITIPVYGQTKSKASSTKKTSSSSSGSAPKTKAPTQSKPVEETSASNTAQKSSSTSSSGLGDDSFFYGPYPTKVNFKKGSLYAQAGLGLLAFRIYSGSSVSIPPLFVAGEYGVTDRFGVGALIGYTSTKYDYGISGFNYAYRFTYLVIGARGTYHFYQDPQWDTYGGVLVGFNIASSRYTGPNSQFNNDNISASSGPVFGPFIGARYYLTPNIALLGEIGYQIALLNLGISLKVK